MAGGIRHPETDGIANLDGRLGRLEVERVDGSLAYTSLEQTYEGLSAEAVLCVPPRKEGPCAAAHRAPTGAVSGTAGCDPGSAN